MEDTAALHLPVLLKLTIQLTDEQFFQLCHNNRDLRFERTATGELIIMPPTGGTTGDRNAELTYQLRAVKMFYRVLF
jgi:Uma2 family endonuclease